MGDRGGKPYRERLETVKSSHQLREDIKEAAERTIGYQPKPDSRGWFDDECRRALRRRMQHIRNGLIDQPEPKDWNTKDCRR